MKIDIDVYVSYSHLDSLELTEGGQGWVGQFRRALQIRITQLLGREASVFLDDRVRVNDDMPEDVVDEVERAGVFVSIMSPR